MVVGTSWRFWRMVIFDDLLVCHNPLNLFLLFKFVVREPWPRSDRPEALAPLGARYHRPSSWFLHPGCRFAALLEKVEPLFSRMKNLASQPIDECLYRYRTARYGVGLAAQRWAKSDLYKNMLKNRDGPEPAGCRRAALHRGRSAQTDLSRVLGVGARVPLPEKASRIRPLRAIKMAVGGW